MVIIAIFDADQTPRHRPRGGGEGVPTILIGIDIS
jgi:hypothetical protein